jgi:hypothetical protein
VIVVSKWPVELGTVKCGKDDQEGMIVRGEEGVDSPQRRTRVFCWRTMLSLICGGRKREKEGRERAKRSIAHLYIDR